MLAVRLLHDVVTMSDIRPGAVDGNDKSPAAAVGLHSWRTLIERLRFIVLLGGCFTRQVTVPRHFSNPPLRQGFPAWAPDSQGSRIPDLRRSGQAYRSPQVCGLSSFCQILGAGPVGSAHSPAPDLGTPWKSTESPAHRKRDRPRCRYQHHLPACPDPPGAPGSSESCTYSASGPGAAAGPRGGSSPACQS